MNVTRINGLISISIAALLVSVAGTVAHSTARPTGKAETASTTPAIPASVAIVAWAAVVTEDLTAASFSLQAFHALLPAMASTAPA